MVLLAVSLKAQLDAGKNIAQQLCGCFEVDFKYAETFSPDPAYKYHEREEIGGTAELALPLLVTDTKIIIQHLLIVGQATVVKHWREEWTYENPVLWKYVGNKVWQKDSLPAHAVMGKWTQAVWEVADEPRYQGLGHFMAIDGKMVWQSTADAPLPRREYTVRNDYQILRRTNRIHITNEGYRHEQDNQKIVKSPQGNEKLLVEEKGWNTYRRIEEKECAAASAYWQSNQTYWNTVRLIWASKMGIQDRVALADKIDDKMLHEHLIEQSKRFTGQPADTLAMERAIRSIIERFTVSSTANR
jgi:hypothetical protein